ncbi:MAG: helix-turn-helix domain-containing protein [Patescibacteria group bacterium]
MPKQFLNVKQVAKILGVTPLTIRNWDKRGKLQAYRNPINNYRVYKIGDVEKLLEEIDESRNILSQEKKIAVIETPKIKKLLVEEL